MITISDVKSARTRIGNRVRHTPVLRVSNVKSPIVSDIEVNLKLECLQVTGSFKARGAMNAVLATDPARYRNGIVTASGGNHGLAVARTAFVSQVPAMIFVPDGVSPDKIQKMRAWNANVEVAGAFWDEANAAAQDFASKSDALYLHPFSDPLIVAGQGTLGLDILDDIPDLHVIVIAIGGGGLIAGLSAAIRSQRPSARIIGVEPFGSPTLKASLDAGRCIALQEVTTKVSTMACRQTDPRIFDIVRDSVDEIVLVSDEDMKQAAQWLWFEMGIAADLSGAASIAALQKGIPDIENARNVCALICGSGSEGRT